MSGLRKLFTVCVMSGAASLLWAPTANAAIIDLVNGNTGTANGAIYNWIPAQSTGTGNIDPFLRVQGGDLEQGYNHSLGGNVPWDTKQGIWTHDLLLSAIPIVNIGGVNYYEFLLDINETRSDAGHLLELNNVQIYTRSTAITSAPDDFSQLGALRFNSDTGADGDSAVRLDFERNPGSGAGDMLMYVPIANFAGLPGSTFVYFYSKFGGDDANGGPANLYDSDDGFEEWAVRTGPTTGLPDGGMTLSLLGCSMVGLGVLRRKFNL